MKRVVLIYFGKLKVPGLEDAYQEYSKRLGRYVDFKAIELKPIKIEDKSEALRDAVLEKEAALVTNALKDFRNPVLWVLDEDAPSLKTSEWAKVLQEVKDREAGDLVLVIGGSLGLADSLLRMARRKLSFGPQTFSHELTRVVLVEQLYRAFSLLAGHPYHNEG